MESSDLKIENETEFGILKGLLDSDEWPQAVPEVQISDENSETDKMERAEGISDMLLPPFFGKKFLDFGCGEGHVSKHAAKEASFSAGYDLVKSGEFGWEEKNQNLLLTSDFEKIKAEGPYDMILIYDVIDHCENPSDLLSNAKSVLSDEGKIYLRCHPWCGRHGGHAYRVANKAFAHLVFSKDELSFFGIKSEFNIKSFSPIETYNKFIEEAGLQRDSEPETDTHEVEDFFTQNPLVKSRILKAFGISEWLPERPVFQMSQSFVDYVLKKK